MKTLALLPFLLLFPSFSKAAAVITVSQSGPDVIAVFNGSLSQPKVMPERRRFVPSDLLPLRAQLRSDVVGLGSSFNPRTFRHDDLRGSIIAAGQWSVTSDLFADSFSGPYIGIARSAFRLGDNIEGVIFFGDETPFGTPFTSTGIWNSVSLQDLGLDTADRLTITYETLDGGIDTITAQVVPEPSAIALVLLSNLFLLKRARR